MFLFNCLLIVAHHGMFLCLLAMTETCTIRLKRKKEVTQPEFLQVDCKTFNYAPMNRLISAHAKHSLYSTNARISVSMLCWPHIYIYIYILIPSLNTQKKNNLNTCMNTCALQCHCNAHIQSEAKYELLQSFVFYYINKHGSACGPVTSTNEKHTTVLQVRIFLFLLVPCCLTQLNWVFYTSDPLLVLQTI